MPVCWRWMRAALTFMLLTSAVRAQVASPEQLFQDAVAAQQRGDDETAIRNYQELLKNYPGSLEARANLGAVLARQGRFDEAIAQYRAALAEADNAALRVNLALAYYKKNDFAEGAKQLDLLHRAKPDDLRISTLLGDCYVRLGKDDQAIAVLGPAEAAHPDDLGVAWLLGSSMVHAGRLRDGLERVEKSAK